MSFGSYHDWIIERQRLLERIKELEDENAELKKRLGEDVVPVVHEPTAMHKLSAQEKVELFRSVYCYSRIVLTTVAKLSSVGESIRR